MSTRTEREKNKRQHDKHLGILMELLREDQNKYCADCRAKGPRWASWNLGIFVCITCAGIHRNLGVHISKVKSVNLDAWTPEQIKNIQEWGNKRAAQYYEFHLPEGFRRPQGDSSLEQFIRNKYEKKLYMNKEGPPPPHEVKAPQEKTNKERKKSPDNGNKKPQQISRPEPSKPVKNNIPAKNPELNKVTPTSSSSATADLLSLSEPPAPQNGSLLSMASTRQDTTADLFNFSGSSLHPVSTNPAHPAPVTSQGFGFDLTQPAPVSNTIQPSNTGAPSSSRPNIEDDLFKDDLSSGGQSTKDSIMALYQPSQKQPSPQMFGVPGGVYLPQQKAPSLNMNQPNTMPSQFGAPYNAQQQLQQQQQQQMYQVNQVQQQMAKLGFKQPTSMSNTLGMQNNQAVPNSQAMPGYNYNQAIPGTAPYNNGSGLYANTPLANGGWMPQKAGNFPQPQPMPQYLTTGPAAPGFNMYPGQGSMPSGQTLSHNLWK